MSRHSTATRRRILRAGATTAIAGLAGCIADGPAAGQDSSPSPSPTGPDDHSGDDHGGDDHDGDDHTDDHSDETHHEDDHHGTPTEEMDDDHSHHDDHHHEDLPDHPADHGEVGMRSSETGEHFSPHVTWVEPGTTITFVNESGAHSATAYHPDNDKPLLMPEGAEAFDTGLLSDAGVEHGVTLETTGVYHYYCAPHESLGMIGSIVVGEPDPHEQPALEDPHGKLSGRPAEKVAELNEMVDRMLGHQH